MRVVEYKKSTATLSYRVIKGAGLVAGVFSLIVCGLLIANNLSLKKTDPIHSPALLKLVEQLKTDPKNEELREEIRELDHIARRAFFTSQHFNRLGIGLLIGGLIIMVVAFKALENYKLEPPYPDSSDPKDDIVEDAKWARKSVAAAGLVLAGFALMIALPWESPLDKEDRDPPGGGGNAPAVKTPPSGAPVATATPEERLENWAGFLGPESGRARTSGLPTEWDGESDAGIRWKTAVPLPGFNSPILWKERMYFSGADKSAQEVYCLDLKNGEMLWKKAVRDVPGSPATPPKVTRDTGYAAATMATDGVRVFAIFATGDLAAFDLDGTQVWAKNLGVPDISYGYSSSLVVHENLLLIQFDHREDSFLFGLDSATGQMRWKTPRKLGPSWSSPALINTGERVEVILSASGAVVSYDPKNGKELWRCKCLERAEVAPSPTFADGLLYVSGDRAKLCAIDVKTHQIVWTNEDLMPDVSTPMVVGDYLIAGLGGGGIVCYNAKTGKELWFEDTDDGFYASPILAENRIYMLDRAGIMHIITPGPKLEVIGTPSLGEEGNCTGAFLGDSLYLRGTDNIYCIGP